MSIIYGNMVGGASGTDGKSAYAYAVEGGYTGTETEFAEKLAAEQLTGTTNDLTPTQVYEAVSAGIPVKVQYTDSTYGLLSFTAFNVAESLNVIVSQVIVYYNGVYILAELFGSKSNNSWGFMSTILAQKTDIPTALRNPNALTFTGAVTGSYDGSAPLSVEIPSGGGSGACPVVDMTADTAELAPNTYYRWGEISALTITLAEPADTTITNEYCFEFASGETATTLTVPDTIHWVQGPSIEAGKTYQVSILNGIGVICGA